MSKTTKRNFLIAITFLLIAGAVFGYMLAFSERQSTALRAQLIALEKQRIQEASYLQMRRTLENASADVAALDDMFLERESDSIDFLNLIEAQAIRNNVTLTTEALSAEGGEEDRYLLVNYYFSGTKNNVRNFITVLEQSQYLAKITGLNLRQQSDGTWEAETTVRVNLFNYVE